MYNNYNYNRSRSVSSPTTLGIPERWERALTYVGLWFTGILFLLIERRNETVRRHAAQSTLIFGVLGLIGLAVKVLGGLLGGAWVVGPLFAFGFGAIAALLGGVTFIAWITLMILALVSRKTIFTGPRYDRYL